MGMEVDKVEPRSMKRPNILHWILVTLFACCCILNLYLIAGPYEYHRVASTNMLVRILLLDRRITEAKEKTA
jgi:hypothetical protein